MFDLKSTTFVFPGQGSQYVGMGRDLAKTSTAAQQTFDEADECLGFKLTALCWEGPEDVLTDTVNAQPALLVCSIAAYRLFIEKFGAVTPAFVAGHSLGEITALVVAGALSFKDGVRLVRERGSLMKVAAEKMPGCMAVLLDAKATLCTEICAEASKQSGGVVQIANDNCPGQIVISGDHAAVNLAMKMAKVSGVKRAAKLPVSIASHSPLMQSAREKFAQVVEETSFYIPKVPVIGNIKAVPLKSAVEIREELAEQLVSPVRWADTVRYLIGNGMKTFVEFGPLDVLTRLLPWFNEAVTGINIGTIDDFRKLQS